MFPEPHQSALITDKPGGDQARSIDGSTIGVMEFVADCATGLNYSVKRGVRP